MALWSWSDVYGVTLKKRFLQEQFLLRWFFIKQWFSMAMEQMPGGYPKKSSGTVRSEPRLLAETRNSSSQANLTTFNATLAAGVWTWLGLGGTWGCTSIKKRVTFHHSCRDYMSQLLEGFNPIVLPISNPNCTPKYFQSERKSISDAIDCTCSDFYVGVPKLVFSGSSGR